MDITFFDDPQDAPRSREDVAFKQLGLYVLPDQERVAVGFDITPFLEPPNIEVTLFNGLGKVAGSLTVIEADSTNFHLTLHRRDGRLKPTYRLRAVLFYRTPETPRQDVHTQEVMVDFEQIGEQNG